MLSYQAALPSRFELKLTAKRIKINYLIKVLVSLVFPIFCLAMLVGLGVPDKAELRKLLSDANEHTWVMALLVLCVLLMLILILSCPVIINLARKRKSFLLKNPLIMVLTHEGLEFPLTNSSLQKVSWENFKALKLISRGVVGGAHRGYDMQIIYSNEAGQLQAFRTPHELARFRDSLFVKKYVTAFAPDGSKVYSRDVNHWRKKYGYVS